MAKGSGSVRAEVRNDGLLVVKFAGAKNLALLRKLADDDARRKKKGELMGVANDENDGSKIKDEVNDDADEGPNRRGTYSKAYVLQHPEIKWVHRGQGRYLPASRGRPGNLKRSQS